MIKSIGKLRTAALMLIASFGLIAGHSLTYYWMAPEAAHRISLLERTGHGYMDAVIATAGPLAFMAVLFVVLLGALQSKREANPSLAGYAMVMAAVQVAGFGLQEVVERIVSGASLSDLATVLSLGLMVQLLVAAAGTLLFVGLHKAGRLIARLVKSRRFQKPSGTAPLPAFSFSYKSILAFGGLRTRGPPALL